MHQLNNRKKRCLGLLLFLFIFVMAGTVTAQAVTLDSAKIKSAAQARVGSSHPAGYCLSFVESVYQKLGVKRPYNCCATNSSRHYIKSKSMKNIPVGATVYFQGSATYCSTCGSRCGHVGIYVGDGKFVHAVNGSVIKSSLSSYAYQFRGWGYCGGFKLKTGEEPVGELESVTVENGRIQVSGWSYDPDSKKKAVTIQVYVGAKAGSGAKKTKLTANQKRTDIGELYEGIGNKHGFSASIKTKKTGKQTVYVYAVDVNDGSKVLLGKKKVTISK